MRGRPCQNKFDRSFRFTACGDDFLRAWGQKNAPQAKMTTAQVMTVALVAVTLFNGNQERSRYFLQEHGFIPKMLSKGAFNRRSHERLHEIPDAVWQALFRLLADVHKRLNGDQEYAVDSLPVPACDNIRIRRCRLYPCPRSYSKARRLPRLYRQQEALLLRAEGASASDDDRPAGRGDAGSRQ